MAGKTVILGPHHMIKKDAIKHLADICGAKILRCGGTYYVHYVYDYDNIITWGMKIPKSFYTAQKDKNFLFLENALLKQKESFYIDNQGYFGDSSIRSETDLTPSQDEVNNLAEKIQEWFNMPLYYFADTTTDKPILFAMQMVKDLGPARYGPGWPSVWKRLYKEYKDRELVIRPHPRQPLNTTDIKMGKKWRIDKEMKPIYPQLGDYSKIVSVNSTVLTEAMALGCTVQSYGQAAYTGYDINDMSERTKYLCSVLRHQISRNADKQALYDNLCIQKWLSTPGVVDTTV